MARASRSGSRKCPQAPSKSSEGLHYQEADIVPNMGTMNRRLKLTSLMNELVSTAEQEPTVDSILRGALRELQLRLQFAVSGNSSLGPLPLPSKAPELWTERKKRESPVEFIQRVYGQWLDVGLSTDLIRRLDFSLYTAYYRFKSLGGHIPPDFVLKTRKELNTEKLDSLGFSSGKLDPAARETLRLLRLAKRRAPRP